MASIDVAAAEHLDHFLPQAVGDGQAGFGRQLVNVGVKQIVLQVDFLNEHFGVEQVSLVYVNIHRVVPLEGLRVDVVLNGGDLMEMCIRDRSEGS